MSTSQQRGPHQRRRRRHRHHHPSTMPHFIQLAPMIMQDLIEAFDLTPVQAAAIVGNLGTESKGFTAYHEAGQPENKGGYGWAQWTGPRRKAFFAWADAHRLHRESEAASLGFLEHELQTSYRNVITILKRQTELQAATHAFMIHFEGPGILNESDRQNHATIALQHYNLFSPVFKAVRDTSEIVSSQLGVPILPLQAKRSQ